MRYRNNLSELSGNSTLVVTEPFDCYVETGITDSNTYFGASMALGRVFTRVRLPAGTLLHDLHGGVFAELHGVAYPAVITVPSKHPFEKTYLRREETWPADHLERQDYQGHMAPRHEPVRWTLAQMAALADRAGSGIDWVLRGSWDGRPSGPETKERAS